MLNLPSSQLALGHEEGLCEAAYLTLADMANIDVPTWKLLDAPEKSGATKWLALKRFDVVKNNNGVLKADITYIVQVVY